MNLKKYNTGTNNLDGLMSNLKNEDARYSRISGSFRIVYWILIAIYSVMMLMSIIEKDYNHLITSICFTLSMLVFAIFFGKYQKEYKYVDYSLPILEVLKKAAYRYKPFQQRTIWLLLAIIPMDIGLCLNSSSNSSVLEVQVFFLGGMLLSTCIGLVYWYYKYKPLRDSALSLIAEITGE